MFNKDLTSALFFLLMPVFAHAGEVLDDEWFADDLQARVADVNRVDLVFLREPLRERFTTTIAALFWMQTVWITAR